MNPPSHRFGPRSEGHAGRIGRVSSFGVVEGAGTVTDGETTWPFHCTQISGGARTVAVGTEVEFDIEAGLPGVWEAVRLRARPGQFLCPVCAATVPGEPGGYDICRSCKWEDDPVQRDDVDVSGANVLPLRTVRDAAMQHLIEQETGELQPFARG